MAKYTTDGWVTDVPIMFRLFMIGVPYTVAMFPNEVSITFDSYDQVKHVLEFTERVVEPQNSEVFLTKGLMDEEVAREVLRSAWSIRRSHSRQHP